MQKKHLILLTMALAANLASASEGALSCSGDMSFVDGANTSIRCTGDLWLSDGLSLSAEESISIWAGSRLEIIEATLSAPRVSLSAEDSVIINDLATIIGMTSVSTVVVGTEYDSREIGYREPLAGTLQVEPGSSISLSTSPVNVPRIFTSSGAGGTLAIAPGGSLTLTGGTLTISPVPEPAPYTMLLAGLGLVATLVRRRN